jgi:hypothetical protein
MLEETDVDSHLPQLTAAVAGLWGEFVADTWVWGSKSSLLLLNKTAHVLTETLVTPALGGGMKILAERLRAMYA